MEQESSSFWMDIKRYEDALAKDPRSYCFAPLSEVYRKLGLLDDAISIAKQGCEIHPEYAGGFMALGRAYYEKGMKEESRAALEMVVRSTPDNILAQKLLCQIYMDAGQPGLAERSLRTLLSLNPGDRESEIMLESLQKVVDTGEVASEALSADSREAATDDDEDILEDLEIIDDLIDEDEAVVESADLSWPEKVSPLDSEAATELRPNPTLIAKIQSGVRGGEEVREQKDPLTTSTLAELYVSQGFFDRALAIYQELLSDDPGNREFQQRVAELELRISSDTGGFASETLEDEFIFDDEFSSEELTGSKFDAPEGFSGISEIDFSTDDISVGYVEKVATEGWSDASLGDDFLPAGNEPKKDLAETPEPALMDGFESLISQVNAGPETVIQEESLPRITTMLETAPVSSPGADSIGGVHHTLSAFSGVSPQGEVSAETTLATLERWLDSIRRRRQ